MNLSIIIPHYNSVSLLRRLLESIFNETEKSEVIVVDDNSTEDLSDFELLKADYEGKVVFLTNDSGIKGPGAARNVGLNHVTGDWLIFADSDDYFINGWYKTVESFFEENYDIVYFNPRSENIVTGKPGSRTALYSRYVKEYCVSDNKSDYEKYLRYFFVVPWSKLIRVSLIRDNKIMFDRLMYSEDVMFSVKVGFNAKSVMGDIRTIYCVTEGDETLSTDNSLKAGEVRLEVLARRNMYLRQHLCKNDYTFCMLRMNAYRRYVSACRESKSIKKALEYYRLYKDNRVPMFRSFLHEVKCSLSFRKKTKKN